MALSRREFIGAAGGATAGLVLGRVPAGALAAPGYVGNGTGGCAKAFPLGAVKLLDTASSTSRRRRSPPARGSTSPSPMTATGSGILYVDGKEVGRNAQMPVVPQWFGNHVTNCWIGRSQYADPYLKGAVDDFRVYDRTLSAAEVAALAT